jgi:hypothetical protein
VCCPGTGFYVYIHFMYREKPNIPNILHLQGKIIGVMIPPRESIMYMCGCTSSIPGTRSWLSLRGTCVLRPSGSRDVHATVLQDYLLQDVPSLVAELFQSS